MQDCLNLFYRDALAKEIYSHLFAWLISRVNGIVFKGKQQLSIAVLDIFGFEVRANSKCCKYSNYALAITR